MKKRIIAEMRRGGATVEEAEAQLTAVVRAIRQVVRADGSARIPNLGTFKAKVRSGRTFKSVATGEMIETRDKEVLAFTPARGLVI